MVLWTLIWRNTAEGSWRWFFPREQPALGIDRVLSFIQCSEVIARKEEYFSHKKNYI